MLMECQVDPARQYRPVIILTCAQASKKVTGLEMLDVAAHYRILMMLDEALRLMPMIAKVGEAERG